MDAGRFGGVGARRLRTPLPQLQRLLQIRRQPSYHVPVDGRQMSCKLYTSYSYLLIIPSNKVVHVAHVVTRW